MLEQRLGMPVTAAELRSLVATDAPGADAYLPAVAVALVAMDPAGLPLDFMDSRLAAAKPPAVSLQKKVGLAAAAVLAVLIGAGVYTLTSKASAVADQEDRNQKLAGQVKDAKALVKRYSDAVAWIPKGPHFVNLVRNLTYIFPQQPNTIWLTNLSSNPEGWEMTGQAVNQNLVHNLVDALLNDPRFLQPNNTQTVLDQNGLITFKIRFSYLGEEPPQETPTGDHDAHRRPQRARLWRRHGQQRQQRQRGHLQRRRQLLRTSDKERSIVTLNKREQAIAWAVGSVVGLFVLYQLVNTVYMGQLNSYNDQLYKDQKTGATDKATLDQAVILRPKSGRPGHPFGPRDDGPAGATLVTNFATQTQVRISNWTAQTVTRPVQKTDYQEATYKMQAKGNSGGFFRFLLSLENSHTPMRVDSIEIVGQPPGQDDLAVNLTLTALIYAPKLPKGAATQPARAHPRRLLQPILRRPRRKRPRLKRR